MESKGGKKKSSSNSLQYEVPLGYSIEDVRPHGGVKKFQSAAYSNVINFEISNFQFPFRTYFVSTFVLNIFCYFFGLPFSALGNHPDIIWMLPPVV
ncbi:hypothetical protein KFK09_015653 [Dendrobium nobile]|uniref:Uncharacterized protein n=1 Tax=Dendrobium nobile TaxID=94219 RepID=A0A8T3B5E4_DENNO|nr:hypothetical protein KFK09_015653 [Dendrobium nobile]